MKKALEAASFVAVAKVVGFSEAALGVALDPNPWYDDLPKPLGWPPQWVFRTAWLVMNHPCAVYTTAIKVQLHRYQNGSPSP